MKQIIGGGFEAYYNQNDDNIFTFDSKFVLVDGWGIIREEYRYQTLSSETDRIIRHIRVLAEEMINSQGLPPSSMEQLLFSCATLSKSGLL